MALFAGVPIAGVYSKNHLSFDGQFTLMEKKSVDGKDLLGTNVCGS
jgi:hypothetical protein